MSRKKQLLQIAQSYNDSGEEKKKKSSSLWKSILKKILKKIAVVLTIKWTLLLWLLIIILFPLIVIIIIMLSIFGGNNESKTHSSNYYTTNQNYSGYFSSENLEIPLWIPVERWRMTYWYDYTKYKSNIITWFLKVLFPWSHEYYSWHRGLDFWKIYQDKKSWHSPLLLSTVRGTVKSLEQRIDNWNGRLKYEKKYLKDWVIYNVESEIRKSQETKLKPYWNNVILSTLDGKFYVMYAHMKELNQEMKSNFLVNRGSVLWKMWNTWNSHWDHLHYEIRICDNNENLTKTWRECNHVNPLWFLWWQDTVFLGIKKLPLINEFIAWNIEIVKSFIKDEDEIKEDTNIEYNSFCKIYKILLTGKKVSCDELFSIAYSNRNNPNFPQEENYNQLVFIWSKYIDNEYWKDNIKTSKQLNEIARLEWINKSIHTENELFHLVGKNLSYGKYNNKYKIYKINDPEITDEKLLNDLIETLEKLKTNNTNHEDLFLKYYDYPMYSKNKNPFVYNMMDKDHIFLPILDNQENIIYKHNKKGSLTIFNQLIK